MKLTPTERACDERFWSKVDTSGGPDSCWLWTANRTRKGYGRFSVYGVLWVAHRFAYYLAKGDIPGGMQLDHICRNTSCVNPAHLRLATNKQNSENRSGARRESRSGIRGVSFHKGQKRWVAKVGHNSKYIWVGTFDSAEEADAAVRAKRLELFTHNDADSYGGGDHAAG